MNISLERPKKQRGTPRPVVAEAESSNIVGFEVSAPPEEELPQYLHHQVAELIDPEGSKDHWTMVETDIGWQLSGERTTASKVVRKLRQLEPENQSDLKTSFSTIEGSKDLLTRLDHCISSDAFQSRVWRRLQGIEEKQVEDIVEQSFIIITHADVVDALAEHLVLSYIHNFHKDQIEVWKSSQDRSQLHKMATALSNSLREIASARNIEAILEWGKYLTATGVGIASFTFYHPKTAAFLMTAIWHFVRISFGLLAIAFA